MDRSVYNQRMHQGRPLEFDPHLALQSAMEVFWRQGYEATSLRDLLAAMAISKSSFYQAFDSKHGLFEQCLELFRNRQVKRMLAALDKAPSGKEFLRATLRSMVREARGRDAPKGCLIMNTATEFSGRDVVVSGLVAEGTRQFTEVFRAAVERAQVEGEIAADRDADLLARYMLTTVSGLKTMVKAGMDAATIEEVTEVALRALD
jgi:TetR/AcrR family transcriptional repressor of nem operon